MLRYKKKWLLEVSKRLLSAGGAKSAMKAAIREASKRERHRKRSVAQSTTTRILLTARKLMAYVVLLVTKVSAMIANLGVKIKILVSLFQVLQGIGASFSIPYPKFMTEVTGSTKYVEIEMPSLLPLSCFIDEMMPFRLNANVDLIIKTMSPILLVSVLMCCSRMLVPDHVPHHHTRGEPPSGLKLLSSWPKKQKALKSNSEPAVASGLKWRAVGRVKPKFGVMVVNEDLAEFLETQTEFTLDEWDSFGVSSLHCEHYVKGSSGRYFQPDDNEIFRLLSDQCVNAAFYIIFLVYPSCSAEIFSHFICESFEGNGEVQHTYMRNDFSINCDSPIYKTMSIYAVLMIFVYPIGTPVILPRPALARLYTNRSTEGPIH